MARINISQILFKRGNTAASMSYTGPVGEVVIDTDLDAFRIQDGQTPGGRLMASTRDFANITANLGNLTSSITTLTGIDANFVANINVLLSNAATQQSTINLLLSNAGVQADAITSLRANIVAANLAIAAASGTYSNANVSAYLTTQTFYSNANVESYFGANVGSLWANAATQATGINTITANIGAFQTYGNLTFSTVANAATQATSIATLQTQIYANANVAGYLSSQNITSANIGAYQTFANANAATQATSINSINANLGAYQTYGNLTFSTVANAATQATSIATLQTQIYANANVASYLPTYTGNISANVVKNGYTWTFGSDGTLTLPALSGQIGRSGYTDGIDLYNNNGGRGYVRMNYANESFVWADSGGSHIQTTGGTWDFGTDGNLTLPTNGDVIMPGINSILSVSGTTLLGGYSQVGGYYSTLGVKYPGAGTQHGMTLQPAADNTTAINFLNATGNSVGNITQTASTVKFTGDGSGLSNVALKTTGSWTVTTGTNTYSFTVPVNGVYQMWVKCNIPNGILAYNATATVTNTNVPVVGAQYAWVYSGGGTPIDFTSIPNQFTGTGNAIVRSSTAPSTTTNRFDFGINNTSGSSQTAYWGYVRID